MIQIDPKECIWKCIRNRLLNPLSPLICGYYDRCKERKRRQIEVWRRRNVEYE
jgi:hypothetical protein